MLRLSQSEETWVCQCPTPPDPVLHVAAGWALCGHELPAGCGAAEGGTDGASAEQAETESDRQLKQIVPGNQPTEAAAADVPASSSSRKSCRGDATAESGGPWQPHHAIRRAERVQLGQQCKDLLDAGRLLWLRQQGLDCQLLHYCHSDISGENRLLLGSW